MVSQQYAEREALIAACDQERHRYYSGELTDAANSLAMIRGMVGEHSDLYWEVFYTCYYGVVEQWVILHPLAGSLLACDSSDTYVHDALLRFMQTTRRRHLQFFTFNAAMRYVQRCVNSIMFERWRRWKHLLVLQELPADFSVTDSAIEALDRISYDELWQMIEKVAPSVRAIHAAQLIWVEGYRPRELPQRFSEEFPNITEIYKLLAKLVRRLRSHLEREFSGKE